MYNYYGEIIKSLYLLTKLFRNTQLYALFLYKLAELYLDERLIYTNQFTRLFKGKPRPWNPV